MIKTLKYISIVLSILVFSLCKEMPNLDDPTVPFPAPTELKAEKESVNSVKLSWKDNSEGEQGFVIERLKEGETASRKYTVGSNISNYSSTNLEKANYSYTVYAYYNQRKTDSLSLVYQHVPVNMPANFKAEANAQQKTTLTWDATSEVIDGYKIERKTGTGSYVLWKTLAATQTTVIDDLPGVGLNTYKLYAYVGDAVSVAVERSVVFIAAPQISIDNLLTSYIKLTPNFTLTSDGGETCTVGVCWSKTSHPTIDDNKFIWQDKLATGKKAFGNAINLTYGNTYYLRAYATNSKFTAYSNEVSGTLSALPQPINLTWTLMPAINASLPAEVRVYETSSSLNGRNFKAYYAIADMSTGNIELKATLATSTKTPSKHIADATSETFYAMTNGGYFSGTSSYSLVIDRGTKNAENITYLTRGIYSYSVTRGAFGVTQSQIPAVKWVSGGLAYNIPSPNVEGESAQMSPSQTFPMQAEQWNPFTAIGGAPILLKNGNYTFDMTTTLSGKYMTNYELLQSDIFSTSIRPPRTVIGSTADNKIILFVCDGRQTHSDGATILELAQILKGLGCVNALNLDGGGSSAIVAGGTLLNKPSDGAERAVPSVVAFVKKK